MRLICGLIQMDGRPVETARLDALVAAQTPPGMTPRVRRWIGEGAALAVLCFEPGGSHPNAGEEETPLPQGPSGLVLAADIRLDEPEALARELGVRPLPSGSRFAHDSLALTALERWGEEAPARLLGDFALAAWDPRTRRLVCARDHMGVRPLCHTRQMDGCFAFASFARALVSAGLVSSELDTDFVIRSGILDAELRDRTPFPAIAKVQAAHWVALTPRGMETPRRYWQLDSAKAGTWRGTTEEATQELARRLTEAVRCRIDGEGPVGSHLSGGLDSSAITVLAARLLRPRARRLHAYSQLAAPVDGLEMRDEKPFVEAVLAQEDGISWNPIHMTGEVMRSGFEIANGIVHAPGWLEDHVCAHAASQGVGCLLSGWGGDQGATFSGVGTLEDALLHGHWRYLLGEFQAVKRLQGTGIHRSLARVLSTFVHPSLLARLRGRPKPLPGALAQRLWPLVAKGLTGVPRVERWPRPSIDQYFRGDAIAARNEGYATIGARHGMAYAFPLLDCRVVVFIHSLPKRMFLREGIDRRIFRDAMVGVLPEMIRWRGKRMLDFPNLIFLLGEHKGRLLNELSAFQREPGGASAGFDLKAMEMLLNALPEGEEARRLVREANIHPLPASIVWGGWAKRLLDLLRCLEGWEGPALLPDSSRVILPRS